LSKDLARHKAECPYRTTECPKKCGQFLNFCLVPQHLQKDCKEVEVECEKGCQTKLKRGELEEHNTKECPFATVPCEFAEYGCTSSVLRVEYEEHLDECSKQHLHLLSNAFKEQKSELNKVKKELDEMQSKQPCLQEFATPVLAAIGKCADRCREKWSRRRECLRECRLPSDIRPIHLIACFLLWAFFNLFPGCLKFAALVGICAYAAIQKRKGRCGGARSDTQPCCKKAFMIVLVALVLSIFNPITWFLRLVGVGCTGYHHHRCYH
jgi:hypothetical protein